MKIEVELKPFQTPNFVLAKRSELDAAGEAKFPLSEVSADALDQLCNAFRREVFKKAGKRDPELDIPRAAP